MTAGCVFCAVVAGEAPAYPPRRFLAIMKKTGNDACARWNVEMQQWDLSHVYDDTTCDDCGIDVSAEERPVQEGA